MNYPTASYSDIRHQDLPTPNVYFVSVTSAITGETHHMYLAADFNGSAFRKAQNLCALRFHFRPYRSNSIVKMRRLKLGDYLENPQALEAAIRTAVELGESDILAGLAKRPQQVVEALEAASRPQVRAVEPVDFDALAEKLAMELRTLDRLPSMAR